MAARTTGTPHHPDDVRRSHERLLAEAGLRSRMHRTADGAAVHVAEKGRGTPIVLIHGSGSPGLFWLPLLAELEGRRVIVVDRPGFGLSDPVPIEGTLRSHAARWCDRLLDALALSTAVLVGHSMGGWWALRYALARPERVVGLALLGTPALPGTHAPLPFRLLATPGAGALLARQKETPASLRRFATFLGEGDALERRPDLVELMVAVGNDPVARRALRDEIQALLAPWALASRSGFRSAEMVTEEDLSAITRPTLILWGDRDPVGSIQVAQRVAAQMPTCELAETPGGHVPWLGDPGSVGRSLTRWLDALPSG